MPIYEYECPSCSHRFDKLMPVSAAPPPCPECGEEQVKKRISAAAFQLKGSGWYKDHYGLKGGSSSKGGSSDSAPASAKGDAKASSSSSE